MTVNSVQLYGSILHASKSTEFQRDSGFVLNVERYEQNNRSLKVVKKKYNFCLLDCMLIIYRSVPQIRPPLCNLSLNTKRREGLYVGCDIFSRDYTLPTGTPPTTSRPEDNVFDNFAVAIWKDVIYTSCQ